MPMLTNLQVVNANGALQALIKADRENQLILSSAVRIRLAGCLRKSKPVAADYDKEIADLGNKYGTKNADGILIIAANDPKMELYQADRAAMEAEPTEIESFSTVTEIDLMGKPDPDGKVKQNQIDIGILTVLMEVGILVA